MAKGLRWTYRLWKQLDDTLHGISRSLQKVVRALTIARVMAIFMALAFVAFAVVLVFYPEWTPYVVVGIVATYAIPFVLMAILLAIPFRWKSVIRLIRKGYPANAEELALRAVARKLRDQSIESERLLWETAWSEGRKMYKRYLHRAKKLQRQLDEMPDIDTDERR